MPETREHVRSDHAEPELPRDMSALGHEMREKAGDTASAATAKARDFAEQQKAAGADNAARLGHAVHEAADQLGKELPQAAGYVHSAADNLQHAASALRERSIEDMMADFSGFARRQPAAAFASAVLAGFALSRFLKSSSPRGHR